MRAAAAIANLFGYDPAVDGVLAEQLDPAVAARSAAAAERGAAELDDQLRRRARETREAAAEAHRVARLSAEIASMPERLRHTASVVDDLTVAETKAFRELDRARAGSDGYPELHAAWDKASRALLVADGNLRSMCEHGHRLRLAVP